MQRRSEDTRSTECSICLEEFRDPRLLPCGHTFCVQCLQLLLVRDFRTMYSILNQTVRCPLCRKNVAVPTTGAQGFARDVLMVDAVVKRRTARRIANGNDRTPARNVTTAPGNSQTQVDRNVTTTQGNIQTQVNYVASANNWVKYAIAFLAFICILLILHCFRGGIGKAFCSHCRLIKNASIIPTQSGHLTMSLICQELFVINPVTSQGEILDRTTLRIKSSWNVPDFYSIARNSFCTKHKYIYVSTTRNTILKFDSDGDIVAKWSTGDVKGRPSLTADCNVAFIPHDNTARIFLYTPYGDLIRNIHLKMYIGGARLNCAVQIPNGNFVVSYGTDSDTQHGLSLIDSNGYVLRSFGGEKGNGTNRVNGAYDFYVGVKSGNVAVVDHNNHRIITLNSDLEYLGEPVSAGSGVWFPHGVLLDGSHDRLFVMASSGNDTKSISSSGKIIVYDV